MNQKPLPSPEQDRYQTIVREMEPPPRTGINALQAFVWGGLVCVVGQLLTDFYSAVLHLTPVKASSPATATMILIGAVLTGFGVFDKLARYAGAGLAVPVTGFSNSMVSAALEFKQEGPIQGIGSKMFMLAGSVITYGVVTAFFVGLIYAIFHRG
ncbi:MAG TPA: stage V sporulation protein AC [Bacillota bacterium]|jgi:stage V sporulation protein AC|nr:stage V sporulation protein AC [Bacillota bacterium]